MPERTKHGETSRTLGWKVILQAAQIARDAGENGKAEQMYERVREIVEKRYEPTDLHIGFVYKELSEFYFCIENKDKGESYAQRANTIFGLHVATTGTENEEGEA